MAASTILLATSKQWEKPRKLVGGLWQTFYIVRSRTESCLALKSAVIFSAGEGFSLTHPLNRFNMSFRARSWPTSRIFLPMLSIQLAENGCLFDERTLAPPFRVLRLLLAVLSRFFRVPVCRAFSASLWYPRFRSLKRWSYIMVSHSTFLLLSRRSVGGEMVHWRMSVVPGTERKLSCITSVPVRPGAFSKHWCNADGH